MTFLYSITTLTALVHVLYICYSLCRPYVLPRVLLLTAGLLKLHGIPPCTRYHCVCLVRVLSHYSQFRAFCLFCFIYFILFCLPILIFCFRTYVPTHTTMHKLLYYTVRACPHNTPSHLYFFQDSQCDCTTLPPPQ